MNLSKLKSNKAFTMQDLAIAIVMLMLLAGTVGSIYLAIFKIQAETQVDELATLYAVQILEHIDKISYEEVTNGIEASVRNEFAIPNAFEFRLDVSSYKPEGETEDLVKEVKLYMNYHFNEKDRSIAFQKLKVKEI